MFLALVQDYFFNMISLKNIMLEAKLYSLTIGEVLDKVLQFDGKTLIFFDTETTGLEPNNSYEQLTQIAAVVVDGSTWKILDSLNEKIAKTDATNRLMDDPNSPEAKAYQKDSDRWMRKYKKSYMHPREVMQMTHYDDGVPMENRIDEKSALIKFEELLAKYPDAILVAHNAVFDMKVTNARRRINGLPPIPRHAVLDTLKIARFFFVPLLQAMESNDWAKEMLTGLLAKTKYKSYSTTLGKLAAVFKIQLDNWHDAGADIKMLIGILEQTIKLLKTHRDIDISKFQKVQGKRYRKF